MKNQKKFLFIPMTAIILLCGVIFGVGWKNGGVTETVGFQYANPNFMADASSKALDGIKGDGVASDSRALQTAVDQVAAVGRTLCLPAGKYRLTNDLNIPSNVEVVFTRDAVLALDSNVVLTVDGTITAGNYQIFTGAGTVTSAQSSVIGNPVWFGAKGDGKTDDTAAFQKALDAFSQVDVPESSAGYVISGNGLVLKTNQKFQGEDGTKAKLIASANTKYMMQIPKSNVQISDISFDMTKSANGICVYFDNSVNALEKIHVSDIDVLNAYRIVTDANSGKLIVTTTIERVNAKKGKGSAFILNNFWGFIYITDVSLDYSQSINVNYSGFVLNDNEGGVLTNVTVKGNGVPSDTAHGIYLDNCLAVWLYHCSAEKFGGAGYYITRNNAGRSQHIYLQNCKSENNKKQGFYVLGSYLQFEGISALNNEGCGMEIAASTKCINVSNATFTGNKSHGLKVAPSNSGSVYAAISGNNNSGYLVNGEAAANTYVNLTGTGNSLGINNSTIRGRVTSAD